MRQPNFWYFDQPNILAKLLYPLSIIFSLVGRISLFFVKPWKASVPVICVGNLVVGGAGKTPAAIALATVLKSRGWKPHFLTRGYGGTTTDPLLVNIQKHSSDIVKGYSSYFEDSKLLKLLNIKNENNFTENFSFDYLSSYKKMQLIEYKLYLSEMMMLKVDRTSMANSLEVRSPFVDHRLIEYMLSHDESHIEKDNSKKILKDLIKNDFDKKFLNRKKMGFVFNVEDWIYNNLDLVKERIVSGKIMKSYNSNIVNILKINKSRMNANRLWKMIFLEEFFDGI